MPKIDIARTELVWSDRISAPHLGEGIGRSKMLASNMPIIGKISCR